MGHDISTENSEDFCQSLEGKKLIVWKKQLFRDLLQEKKNLVKVNIDTFGLYNENSHNLYVWLENLMKQQ